MEVPERMVNFENWVSPSKPVSDLLRVKAANISIPGAAMSGYITIRNR